MTSQNSHTLSNNLNSNTSIANHPFIWGNIALIAGVPWLLALSMAGLAVGDPVFPAWLEILLLGVPAIAAAAWLHWQQPFSPFSLWFLVKPSDRLNADELRVLTLLKQQRNGWYVTGWIAVVVGFVMSGIFCKLYVAAPLAQAIAPFPAGLRLFGIIWAEVFFFLSNILLQSVVSALRIKLTAESEVTSLQPFAIEKIRNNFTNIGWQVPQLLKFFEEEPVPETVEKKDAPPVETTEQNQDIVEESVEESQDLEISDSSKEIASESTLEVTESTHEDLGIDSFTEEIISKEVIAEDEAIAEDLSESLISEDLEIELIETSEQAEIESFVGEEITEPEIEAISDFTSENLVEEADLVEEFIEVTEELDIDQSIAASVDELAVDELAETNLDLETISEESQESEPAPLVEANNLNVEEESQYLLNRVDIDEPNIENPEDEVLDIADENTELVSEDSQELAPHDHENVENLAVSTESIDSVDTALEDLSANDEDTSTPVETLTIEDNDESKPQELLEFASDLELESTLESTEDVAIFDGADLTFEESNEVSEQSEIELHQEVTTDELDTPSLSDVNLHDNQQLEIKEPKIDAIADTAESNPKIDRNPEDLFKKSRRKGFAQKNYGFGKSIKTNVANDSTSEQVESNIAKKENEEVEIGDFVTEEFVQIDAIAYGEEVSIDLETDLSIEQIETSESESLDFDDELDELITFNAYLENILQDYLEDSNEESDSENQEIEDIQEVEDIIEIASVSEQATDIAEEVLLEEEILETSIPELIEPPFQLEPPVEAIAQTSEPSQEKSQQESATYKDPRYLVQEFLVDKYLAKLEELNNADKSTTKPNLESKPKVTEVISQDNAAPLNDENLEPEQDEFADLETLLNRNIPEENQG